MSTRPAFDGEVGNSNLAHVEKDRRRWPRMTASSLGDVSASIVAGPPATLVNLSRGGALLEVAGSIPLTGSIRVKFTPLTGERIHVEGSLAWAKVARIAGGRVTYRIAVEFTRPIPALVTHEINAEKTDANEKERHAPRAEDLGRKLAAATIDLACQTALVESLAAKLEASLRMQKTASAEWERERRRSQDERASLVQQVAEAMARADALQARQDAREREHGETEHTRDDCVLR